MLSNALQHYILNETVENNSIYNLRPQNSNFLLLVQISKFVRYLTYST